MKLLLDTNAYSAFMQGKEEVISRVRCSEIVIMSSVVIGEIMYGFRNGTRLEENLALFDDFLAQPLVEWLPVTLTTADRYARIATALRKKGQPIPTNDIWIAAHTLESGADLITYDQHFAAIENLPSVCIHQNYR